MALEGVDYSFGRPGGAALRAAGKAFAVRYIGRTDGAGLSAPEVADLRASGIAIVLVFESASQRALAGVPAGAADATTARTAAALLGIPADRPIYFAVDWNATPAQQPTIDSYLAGAASVLGAARVGVYGGLGVIQRCQASRSASWFWQTYAWSGTPTVWAPASHLQQYLNGQSIGGAAVDLDRALFADYGQWPVPTPALTYTLHVAAGARVLVATVKGSCIAGWTTRVWGPKSSSAPSLAPVSMRGCASGSAMVAKVTAGAFAGRFVRIGPGVTVTSHQ